MRPSHCLLASHFHTAAICKWPSSVTALVSFSPVFLRHSLGLDCRPAVRGLHGYPRVSGRLSHYLDCIRPDHNRICGCGWLSYDACVRLIRSDSRGEQWVHEKRSSADRQLQPLRDGLTCFGQLFTNSILFTCMYRLSSIKALVSPHNLSHSVRDQSAQAPFKAK